MHEKEGQNAAGNRGEGGKINGYHKSDFVKWFSELSNKDVKIAGGKGASLAEMYNLKMPVPPGFVITAYAYKYFIEKAGLVNKMKELFSNLDMEDTVLLEKNAEEMRKLISNAEMPDELEKEIWNAYEMLDADKRGMDIAKGTALSILKNSTEMPFVAVRSSATAEDLADASFAGQQESFLNVKGKTALTQKTKECFASLFTARAVYYRTKKGFSHTETYLAVVVQKMIDSEKSGVMFSKNPIKNDSTIMIEAVFGLGEGIVSGMIKPDSYIVDGDLSKFNVLDVKISEKKVAIVRTSSGKNEIVRLVKDKANKQVLNSHEIKILSQYAKKLEEHYKKPQDIEFAIEGGEVYIVQSRPITTLEKLKEIGFGKKTEGKVLLSGLGASPGVASGVVKVIKDLRDLDKIVKGDVLVTIMTNPDMVVTMQKSAAIVTDEGGVTCFAEDTKVLTTQGFMTIKEAHDIIKLGGELILLAYNSKDMKPAWKRIISAGKRKRQAIRISVSQRGITEENLIDLTPDHKMIIFENRNLIKKEICSVIKDENYVNLLDSLPYSEKFSFNKLAYLMGALMSDGNIKIDYYHTGNPRRGRITFTQKDTPQKEAFVSAVQECFEECFGDKFKNGREKCSHSYIGGRLVSGVALDYICNNLEVASAITKISQNLDSWILGLDKDSCLNFLAGLIDGDGCLYQNRLHIYVGKENVLQGVILACMNLGIFPQITKNRTIHHVQIVEKISDILRFTNRVKGEVWQKSLGTKLFSAKQILEDVIDDVNYKGRIKPYIQDNLLIDSEKIKQNVLGLVSESVRLELMKVINSGLRMHRAKKVLDIGEIDVYNLEIEADDEIGHNFIAFTKKYTPLLVSNSHAAIVSREMGIPAVVGTGEATSKLKDGMIITVDGLAGKVYEGKGETHAVEINPIVHTKTKIKVMVDLPDFAERAAKSGAKAVGLVRIEGIIAESGKHPLGFVKQNKISDYEEILFSGLKRIAMPFEEIWIRTSDIRSDEFRNLEGAPKEIEGNPMLGNHGVRFSLKHKEIMKAELDAVKKLASEFPMKIFGVMMPQVISVSEVEQTKKIASEISMPANVKIGIMVETPAAVQIINELCEAGIKFASFGTNDLTQYTLAIDRNNSGVQDLYDEMNPAVLNSLRYVIKRCKSYGVETSICGQAGSREDMAKFLVQEGIDSISVNADAAEKVSRIVAEEEKQKLEDVKRKKEAEESRISLLHSKNAEFPMFVVHGFFEKVDEGLKGINEDIETVILRKLDAGENKKFDEKNEVKFSGADNNNQINNKTEENLEGNITNKNEKLINNAINNRRVNEKNINGKGASGGVVEKIDDKIVVDGVTYVRLVEDNLTINKIDDKNASLINEKNEINNKIAEKNINDLIADNIVVPEEKIGKDIGDSFLGNLAGMAVLNDNKPRIRNNASTEEHRRKIAETKNQKKQMENIFEEVSVKEEIKSSDNAVKQEAKIEEKKADENNARESKENNAVADDIIVNEEPEDEVSSLF